ncbi:MAG: hypothetical protein NT001_07565 [Candidatus Woesearchaeota archaeon]|nr:hypothetical protein [Candidatus Woesearchaeota archaeon]
MDDEEIRRRKLEEIRQRYHQSMENQAQDEGDLHQQIQQIELIIKQKMTKEALQRYSNIKAADPERSVQVIALLAQLIQAGRMDRIGDSELKKLLMMITPRKRETKIVRK